MTSLPQSSRTGADACPGVARPFGAADGAIVRVRTGARPVTVSALRDLLDIVAGQSDPQIQLTSRGALQLRGLPDPLPAGVRTAIAATGLVPSASHELARNIVASPLSGLGEPGLADVRGLVAALDAGLCDDPALAGLPGRFLLAVDDGRGDVVGSGFDIAIVATGPDFAAVLAGGPHRGWAVPVEQAVGVALDLAREFLATRERLGSTAWHVRELGVPLGAPGAVALSLPTSPPPSVGRHGDHAVVAVPLGLLTPARVAALADVTDEVIVTPWRSLVVLSGAGGLSRLASAGLVIDPSDPWLRLHACTGLPGCARSAIDTRRLAHELAPRMPLGSLPVHVSGCERRCGTPRGAFVDVLAPSSVPEALSALEASEAALSP
ncbi:precorrin-3B synthase [Intrasporangium sp. DVR]|uniref:precorrin-3B synthase n=1 Tax=Intrasporangium sp. DVR TaxID=3127867 RepID=UPI00313A648F